MKERMRVVLLSAAWIIGILVGWIIWLALMAMLIRFVASGSHVGIRQQVNWPPREIICPVVPAVQVRPVVAVASQDDLIDVRRLDGEYWTCDLELPVRSAPGEAFPQIDTLHYGDVVRIGERSKGTPGWAMIGRARWVWAGGLCRR